MGIRDIVNQVPAKPIIAAALMFTLAAAAWNLQSTYRVCAHRAALSASLYNWAEGVLSGGDEAASLAAAMTFAWDQVRVSQSVASEGTGLGCPFGWHWSSERREEMIAAGELTLLGFFVGGSLTEIVDLDGGRVRFDVDSEPLTREAATFKRGVHSDLLELVPRSVDQNSGN